ncbi:DUF1344 domain-containing protein [Antarcticirhabdus aurantiaca]|uniref:DUF1344 domain-containing protein n=1 Tax=Antarcticirhabdus aurantiaca TaxID=2606717 RepID=A0ACD4NKW1_9HYPH|nr:DUF1344 domain-containing protein [Antarcticirhabdus aurantiaca]WAJ27305.1 DUF1344 domain-containing protein [Jeongeuplla avenae]
MTRKIIAFFACSFLSVSMNIPAKAEEASGTVSEIDEERSLLVLDDGSTFELPHAFDYEAVKPGMQVLVLLDPTTPVVPALRLVG